MPFGLVSAWNKRRRSKSDDHLDPWVYRPVECWKLENDQKIQNPPSKKYYASSVFTLKEMEEATCSFSEEYLLGKGGFGRVYKGKLQSGEVVAIKKMELPPFKAAEGEREFRVEVDILSRLDHPNLVSLIGYCADGKHRFLVYEYMHKGNLQDHLNDTVRPRNNFNYLYAHVHTVQMNNYRVFLRIGEKKMDWPVRLKVAIGAARGLAYLHSSSACGIPVVHRDFKSTNILLSDDYEAKISDFGLAKLMPKGTMSRSSRTLYVGNLPGDIHEREVEDLFYKFEEALDAKDAIRGRDGYDFDGHRLRVELAHGGPGN
ncbi:hypothetical protein OSB04_003956 [Centaurea solstitialis]|uniref:non-specific serine/threonine protein kinase n=1 Tax=Centaurea solstitialis TaxID=347529 RepID=A0AA38TVX5_9ASTR|nr:hypothetical protein OSB04_003956 [Centaurea solstitialis]